MLFLLQFWRLLELLMTQAWSQAWLHLQLLPWLLLELLTCFQRLLVSQALGPVDLQSLKPSASCKQSVVRASFSAWCKTFIEHDYQLGIISWQIQQRRYSIKTCSMDASSKWSMQLTTKPSMLSVRGIFKDTGIIRDCCAWQMEKRWCYKNPKATVLNI